jgi:hypothetical protein
MALPVLARLLEVHRHLGGELWPGARAQDLQPLGDLAVQPRAVDLGEPPVEKLPVGGVEELVVRGRCPVRELVNPGRAKELLPLGERLADVSDLRVLLVRRRQRPGREPVPDDARARHDPLLQGAELLELHGQHLLQRLRDAGRDLAERDGQGPASSPFPGDESLLQHLLDDRDHEQGVATRVVVDQCAEPRGQAGEPRDEIGLDVRSLQVVESDLGSETVDTQIFLEDLERIAGRDHVRRPEGADDEEPRSSTASCQRRDHVQCREIDPVEILEDQGDRATQRRRLERLAELADHPVARRP